MGFSRKGMDLSPNAHLEIQHKLLVELAAANWNDLIDVVIYLRPPSGKVALPQDELLRICQVLFERVSGELGSPAANHTPFEQLSSVRVAARPLFIRVLITQPEVRSAVSNME